MIKRAIFLFTFHAIAFYTIPTYAFSGATDCFTGDYKSLLTYTNSRGASNAAELAQLKERYEEWRKVDKDQVACKFFTYMVDDIPVTGFYLLPRNIDISNLLPVIFNRGGNADSAIQTPYFYDKLADFSARGFLVIGSFYRGATINGVSSPYRLTDQFGGEDVNDVLALLPIIDSFKGMAKKKVGIWGVSRGGMMAFLAAKRSGRFSAIVADSTPVNLLEDEMSTGRMNSVFLEWIPNYKDKKELELKRRSVVYWHNELNRIPVLMLHGTGDRQASPLHVLQFAEMLQTSDYPYELVMFHGATHGLRGLEDRVNDRAEAWFRKYAK